MITYMEIFFHSRWSCPHHELAVEPSARRVRVTRRQDDVEHAPSQAQAGFAHPQLRQKSPRFFVFERRRHCAGGRLYYRW